MKKSRYYLITYTKKDDPFRFWIFDSNDSIEYPFSIEEGVVIQHSNGHDLNLEDETPMQYYSEQNWFIIPIDLEEFTPEEIYRKIPGELLL